MDARPNGQGHHPKARPYISNERGICIRKIIRIVSPTAQRLALMCNRLGMSALATCETTLLEPMTMVIGCGDTSSWYVDTNGCGMLQANDAEPPPKATCVEEPMLEPMTVVMGCGDNSPWYVDTNGCGMLQANDAEPPPKNRFVQKALQYAAIFIISLALVCPTSCQKDPGSNPTPDPITTDTITPPPSGDTIVPPTPVGDTAVLWVFINYENRTLKYPTMDTLRKLVNDERYLAINLKWGVPPNRTSGWDPAGFHQPRDSLRVRFALSPKIFGSEKIYVNENYGGASIPCEDSLTLFKLGMTKCDSAIFANWGYEVVRRHQEKSNINTITSNQEIWNMNRAILE